MDPAPPEVSPEDAPGRLQEEEEGDADEERWSRLLPELLTDIVRRTNASAEAPLRAMSSAGARCRLCDAAPSSCRSCGADHRPSRSAVRWISPLPVAGSGA
ncbi:hypothetical protein ZWY2020_046547 [Hordeum vulgare]|nr:hypothetical protein ZWY2020_046547 [Hordeum vulgare]